VSLTSFSDELNLPFTPSTTRDIDRLQASEKSISEISISEISISEIFNEYPLSAVDIHSTTTTQHPLPTTQGSSDHRQWRFFETFSPNIFTESHPIHIQSSPNQFTSDVDYSQQAGVNCSTAALGSLSAERSLQGLTALERSKKKFPHFKIFDEVGL